MDPKIVQAVVAPAFLLFGLSHVTQPRLWVEFFVLVRNTRCAAFIIPMFTLPVSLVLLVGHNVWVWDWAVFLTVAGWGMTLKSTLYLVIPGFADRVIDKPMAKNPRSYQLGGLLMVFLAGILTWRSCCDGYYLCNSLIK